MTNSIIKREDLESIFDNQLYMLFCFSLVFKAYLKFKILFSIEKLRKTSLGLSDLSGQSFEKYKFSKENFEGACKNIIKIKKDMEFIQKAISKIKFLKTQKNLGFSGPEIEKNEKVFEEIPKLEELLENPEENNKIE